MSDVETTLKRFAAFYGYDYYPSGGFKDFEGAFDTVDEATLFLEARAGEHPWALDWGHVVDLTTGKAVWSSET